MYKQMKREVGYRDECINEVPLWNFRIHEVFIKMISSPRDIPINWMAKYRLNQDFVSSKTVVIKKNYEVGYDNKANSPLGNNSAHCKNNENNWMPWRIFRAFLIAQSVKNLPAMQEIQVQFLGQEDPLEKEMATHSSILFFFFFYTSYNFDKPWKYYAK